MSNKINDFVRCFFIVLLCIPSMSVFSNSVSSGFNLESIPDDFKDAIYDVPLAVRINVNDAYFTDGIITISKENFVKLIKFEQSFEKRKYDDVNKIIEKTLASGLYLGVCECTQIINLQYDPNTSLLAIYTDGADSDKSDRAMHFSPDADASGVVLQNIFSGTMSGENDSYSYIGSAATNFDSWTGYSNFNMSQHTGSDKMYMLNDLYAQTDFAKNQLKIGFFTPNYTLSGGVYAVIPNQTYLSMYGVSYGSSQQLSQYGGSSSLIPLTVTASQNGYVEIYKANQLIGTFPVKPGIQSIPTESFPDGIYSVEVRLYEGAGLAAISNAEINKAINFSGPPLKYKFFAGRKTYIRSPSVKVNQINSSLVLGGSLSYLFNTKLNLGFSVLQDGTKTSAAASSTLDVSNKIRLYNNIYNTNNEAFGGDVQIMFNDNGFYSSLSTSYSDAKTIDTRDSYLDGSNNDKNESEILRTNLMVGGNIVGNEVYTALAYDHKEKNKNISFGINYNLDDLFPLGSYLTASISKAIVKDSSDSWNGTINLSVPIDMEGRAFASIGLASQKNSTGGVDSALTANYSKTYDDGLIRGVSSDLSLSEKNVNGTISTSFQSPSTIGTGYFSFNRSDYEDTTTINKSIGMNLNNALVIAPGAATLTSGNGLGVSNTGVLINVESSFEDNDLVANVDGIGSIPLKSGTNFIPIQPYKNSTISYDLINGGKNGGATFDPPSEQVALYPGGVVVKKVSVMRTVTVLGRVVDERNNVIKGVEIRNHAGFSIPESDGIFVLEMSIDNPRISILEKGTLLCDIDYTEKLKDNNSMIFNVGNVYCTKDA